MVTLQDVLAAKEARAARQHQLIAAYHTPLISLTVNMPGPVKDTSAVRLLSRYGLERLCEQLEGAKIDILYTESHYPRTGPEILVAAAGEAGTLKKLCRMVEEEMPFGRLLDIDVLDVNARPLSRRDSDGLARACLVCGGDATVCRREQRHTMAELLVQVDKLLEEFMAYRTRRISRAAEYLGSLAVEAMLCEVACTPSPGLVDRVNNGAHRDMDFYTFMDSTAALALGMARFAQAGLNHEAELPQLLPVLRVVGREVEQAMFAATRGVNTHKGLVFTLGLTAAAAGWCWRRGTRQAAAVLETVAGISQGLVARELAPLQSGAVERPLTAGERLYRQYGITGVRGEVEQGLPSVRNAGLPALREALAAGLSRNAALLHALMAIMAVLEDTNVGQRHNREKMAWVRRQAAAFMADGGMLQPDGERRLKALDESFTVQNVSPGGVADMLAVTWFLHRLEEETRQVRG